LEIFPLEPRTDRSEAFGQTGAIKEMG
jgi:hypothetical protein